MEIHSKIKVRDIISGCDILYVITVDYRYYKVYPRGIDIKNKEDLVYDEIDEYEYSSIMGRVILVDGSMNPK
jgi:hypothetical protein